MIRCNVLILFFVILCAGAAEHPHLLFGKKDLPLLRERIRKEEIPRRAYEALLRRAEKHLSLKAPNTQKKAGQLSDSAPDPLSELALAWQLSGEPRFRSHLSGLLKTARLAKTDLYAAGYDIALIFDWSYEFLEEEERVYLKNELLRNLESHPKFQRFPYFAPYSNWGLFMYMPIGIRQAAVLYGHPEFDAKRLDRMAEALRLTLTHFIDDDGAPAEHGAYLNYPMQINGAAASVILDRKGYRITEKTNLKKIPRWMILETTAARPLNYFPMSDCNLQAPEDFILRFFRFIHPDDPAANHLLLFKGSEQNPSPDPISGILWYRKPEALPLAEIPSAKYFRMRNLLLYRSSWDENAFQFAVQAIPERGHSHSDIGSFLLFANGNSWAHDPGYGLYDGKYHNLVTVNGEGPSAQGGAGVVSQQMISPWAVTITMDSLDAWNTKIRYALRRENTPRMAVSERMFALLCPDSANKVPPYLLVHDFHQSADKQAVYAWNLQQDASHVIVFDKNRATVSVPAKEHSALDVFFLTPETVTLRTEKHSIPGKYRKSFQTLKAETSGEKGFFFTLLYPREKGMPEPEMKFLKSWYGFSWQMKWPEVSDYLGFSSPEGRTPSAPRLAALHLARVPNGTAFPKTLPDSIKYLMINGGTFKSGGHVLFEAETVAGDRTLITYPRVALLASVIFDGKTLRVDLYPELGSAAFKQDVRIRAFAPNLTTFLCNGRETVFQQQGKYVTAKIFPREIDQPELERKAAIEQFFKEFAQ